MELDSSTLLLSAQRWMAVGLQARTGQPGPDDVTPRVLVTVPREHRRAAVRDLADGLPSPAAEMITVVRHDEATAIMIDILQG